MAIRKVRIGTPGSESYIEENIGAISNNIVMSDDNTESLDTRLASINTPFTGTDGTSAGAKGVVPAPATTDAGKFLKADGTWGDPAGGVTSVNGETGDVVLDAEDVGAIDATLKGAANGVAELDSNGKVPSTQLPSYVDDVIEGYLKAADGKFYETKTISYDAVTPVGNENPQEEGWYEFDGLDYNPTTDTEIVSGKTYYEKVTTYTTEITGETGKIYIDKDTNKTYRWSGTVFAEISESLALGETSSTAYRGDRGKAAYDHSQDSGKISSAVSSGLYKIAATSEGHIAGTTAVEKTDITALGIPAQDTTYQFTDTSVNAVNSYTDGTLTDFTIVGDTLRITKGVLPTLVTASATVLTSATPSNS